jgi:hypothetical protein
MRHGIRAWAGVVLVAATAAGADERSPGDPERLEAAGIELVRLPPVTRELMVRELNEVLAPGGVGLRWRWTTPRSVTRPDQLRVVFLDSRGRGAHRGRTFLACSGLTGPVTSVWVYVPNVTAALGRRTGHLLALGGMRELGTALGRVLAHEIVHVLAPELPHGEGLMAARFGPGHLALDPPRLDDDGTRVLRAAAGEWRQRGGALPAPERQARAAAATRVGAVTHAR